MNSTLHTKLTEHVVVKKYAGDGPNDRTDEPDEIIELHNGLVIKHTINGIEVPLE